MTRKIFHILVIAILALNLMGAWAYASLLDCDMDCCKLGEWAASGVTSFEAPSCCDFAGVTCGFEAGQVDELFDEALCCFNVTSSNDQTAVVLPAADEINAHTHLRTLARTYHSTGPPLETPLYLSNATFLC